VPGHGAGLFEEQLNLPLYLDECVLGHFRDGTPYTWVLSSMAFGATVLLGVCSGHLLRAGMAPWKKVVWLVLASALCLALGWAWSQPWMGSLRCPIIKHLFTSSMVLWACGWSYLLLALFYLVIDMLGFRKWAFVFIVIGHNAIFAYMAHSLLRFENIANVFVGGAARNLIAQSGRLQAIGQTLNPLAAFAILWLILWYLYRNRTFIRV
jgi:predicted acyltransferase